MSLCRAGLHDLSDPANVYIQPSGKPRCRHCKNQRRTEVNDRLRDEVTAAYGGKCAECGKPGRVGFGTPDALHVDHVSGDGHEHRASLNRRGAGVNTYVWLRRNGWPASVQLLCEPCHKAKTARERAERDSEETLHPLDVVTSIEGISDVAMKSHPTGFLAGPGL